MQDINKLLAQLTARRRQLATQIDDLDRRIEAAQLVLAMCEGTDDNSVDHLGSTAIEIAHCTTQTEAAKVLAQANEGILRVTPAAKVILAAGLSEAKLTSITSSLHHRLNSSADWEYYEPGAFRLVSHAKKKHVQSSYLDDPIT